MIVIINTYFDAERYRCCALLHITVCQKQYVVKSKQRLGIYL